MTTDPRDIQRMEELARWFDGHDDIPNRDRIVQKLRNNQLVGHLVNAEFTKRFYENGTYRVTDVEASDGTHDIDIQLDGRINIQTWHGQSTAGHIMEAQFEPGGREKQIQLGNVTPLGGVRTNWEKDCAAMKKKLSQLPDDQFGVVLLLDRFVGVTVLPEWWEEIPENKCVIKMNFTSYDPGFVNVYGNAVVYHSENFWRMEEVKRIISAIGFNFSAENIP